MWAAIKQRLEIVAADLRRLDTAALGAAVNVEAAPIREAVTGAMRELAAAVALLPPPDPLEIARVPCPFCAQMIMPAATLCGFCWHKTARPAGE